MDGFTGINLADYSLQIPQLPRVATQETRELLGIVVNDILLRFDRMFITYNLYESPGKLYVGEVNVQRNPSANSRMRRR